MIKLNLIITFYNEIIDFRRNEILASINFNVNNNIFDKVIIILENAEIPEEIYDSSKISFIRVDKRLKFCDLFNYFEDGHINVISNNDIILKFSKLTKFKLLFLGKKCLALTRFELSGELFELINGDSQDTWVFGKKVSKCMLFNKKIGDYFLGILGCDNRFLFELRHSGLDVLNLPWAFPTIHNHSSNIRNYSDKDRLMGMYMWLKPQKLLSYNTVLILASSKSYRLYKYLCNIGILKIFYRNY
jgi:hypothetical protein